MRGSSGRSSSTIAAARVAGRSPGGEERARRLHAFASRWDQAGIYAPVPLQSKTRSPSRLETLPPAYSSLPHIGIVSDRSTDGRPLLVHNIGAGAKVEDILFAFTITGHYRYVPGKGS